MRTNKAGKKILLLWRIDLNLLNCVKTPRSYAKGYKQKGGTGHGSLIEILS
jgi:hypothetical protein